MTELDIPERAVDAALAVNVAGLKLDSAQLFRLEAAAPIIVAAAYRDAADFIDGTSWSSEQSAAYLRNCAAELDPEGTFSRYHMPQALNDTETVSVTEAMLMAGMLVGLGGESDPIPDQTQLDRAVDLIIRAATRRFLPDGNEALRARLAQTDDRLTNSAVEIDQLHDALRLIAESGCAIYTEGHCWDHRRTRERPVDSNVVSPKGHRRPWYASVDGWCHSCIAKDALEGGQRNTVSESRLIRIRRSSNEFGDCVYQPGCDCEWFGWSFYMVKSAEQSLSAHEYQVRAGSELDLEGNTT